MVGLQPASSVSLVDTDLSVEFLPSEEQEEEERREEAARREAQRQAEAAMRASADAAEEASVYVCTHHDCFLSHVSYSCR